MYRKRGGGSWNPLSSQPLALSVDADPITISLTATNVTHNAATLTISNYSSAWYYKAVDDAGLSAASCSSAVSSGTTTASLSSLAGNTSYTYKAYSDSSCATELTSASTDVALLTQPAKPTTPTVTAGVGSGKLTISSSVSGGSRPLKEWQYTKDGTNWSNISSTSTSLSHTVTTGLTNGTSYTFKVRAVNEAGSGVSGGGTGPASAASTATAPQDETLAISDPTTTSLKLTIANHPGDWYYKHTIPSGGDCSTTVSAGTATAIATGLTPNTSYTFKAYSDSGCTTELATAAAASTLALPELTASDATDTSLKLTIANHSGDWYYKYTSPTPAGNCSTVVSAGTATAIATGLTANTTYTFKAYSDSTCTTANVLATATAKSTLALTASAPSDTSRSDTSLDAHHRQLFGELVLQIHHPHWWQLLQRRIRQHRHRQRLDSQHRLHLHRLSNNGCTTELATAASFTTPPGIPPRLYLKEESELIKVWWQAPAGATTARLQRSQTNGNWDSAVSGEIGAAEGAAQSAGLTNGTTYYLRLSFKNANSGWGPGSILKATPGPVAFNATATGQNRATLRLSKYDDWGNLRPENVVRFDNKEYREESIKNQGTARTDWSYKQTSPPPPEDTCTDVAKAAGAEATVTGLSSGTRYTYKAYSGSGCTDANALGDEASFRTRTPAPPTPPPASPEISASAVTATTATLTIANYSGSWYYKRTAPTEGDHPYGTCSAVVTGTSVELTGLSASTSYSFTAYSDGNCTTVLATATVSTLAPAVTLTATDATATSLKLTIANHSGSWYYKYTIPSGGQCSSAVSGSTAVASGLQSSTSYTFKAYSDSSCTTVLATTATTSTLAPAVTLTATDATATSLKLTIANHSGSWYYKYTTPGGGQCSNAVAGSTAVASGLQSSTSYTFKAYSDSGCTTVLATAAATSTLAPAVTLTATDATATSLKLTIANHLGNWYYKYTTPSGGQCSSAVSGTTAVASGLQ